LQIHRRVSGRRSQTIAVDRMNIRTEIEQQLDDPRRSSDDSPMQRRAAGAIGAVDKRRFGRGQCANATEIAAFCRNVNRMVALSGMNSRAWRACVH
jgi:hypothetical protein